MLHCALADAIIGIQTENYWLQVYALSENRKKQNVPNSSFYNNSWDQLKYELEGNTAFNGIHIGNDRKKVKRTSMRA